MAVSTLLCFAAILTLSWGVPDDRNEQQVLAPLPDTQGLASEKAESRTYGNSQQVASDKEESQPYPLAGAQRFAADTSSDTGKAESQTYAFADAQAFEVESLSALLAVICQGEESGFIGRLLLETAFPSNTYLPFGVTSKQVSDKLIDALKYGHCQNTPVRGDVASAVVTTGPAPALSYLMHNLLKESFMAQAVEQNKEMPESPESYARMDLVGSLMYDEIKLRLFQSKKEDANSLLKLFEDYQKKWLEARRITTTPASVTAPDPRFDAFKGAMEVFAKIAGHQDLYAVRGAFSHVTGYLCLEQPDNQSEIDAYEAASEGENVQGSSAKCSTQFAMSMTQLYLSLLFRQVHPIAFPRSFRDATDEQLPEANKKVELVNRYKNNLFLFYVAQSAVNGMTDAYSIGGSEVGSTLQELGAKKALLTGGKNQQGASALVKNMTAPPAPGTPALAVDDNLQTSKNSLLVIFQRLGLASTNLMTPQLSPKYVSLVKQLYSSVRKTLFADDGTPVAVTYPQGTAPKPIAPLTSSHLTAISTGYLSYSLFVSPEAQAQPETFLSGIKRVAKAILMLDVGRRAGAKAGDAQVDVPPMILAASQIAYASGRHDSVFNATAVGLLKYSEDKLTLRAGGKWETRNLFVNPNAAGYLEAGKTADKDKIKKVLPYTEMEALMLPPPTTESAKRDNALAAAFTKQEAGHLCGSFLQTSAKDIRARRRRRRNLANPQEDAFNFSGAMLSSEVKDKKDKLNTTNTLLSTLYERHNPALYIPDPKPTSRYFTFCTKEPIPAGDAKSANVAKWTQLQARPLLQVFCAAAANQGTTAQFALEERFNFIAWARTVKSRIGGKAADSTKAAFENFAGTNVKATVIEALKSNGLMKAPAPLEGSGAYGIARVVRQEDKAASSYAWSLNCADVLKDAVLAPAGGVSAPAPASSVIPASVGQVPADKQQYLAQVPLRISPRLPLDMSPVIALRGEVGGDGALVARDSQQFPTSNLDEKAISKQHPIFAYMEKIAPEVLKDSFADYPEDLVKKMGNYLKRPDLVKTVAGKLKSLHSVGDWNLRDFTALEKPQVPQDPTPEFIFQAEKFCKSPATEKELLLKTAKVRRDGTVGQPRPPLRDRHYFALHSAMTSGNRKVLLAMSPAAKLMSWFATQSFSLNGFSPTLHRKLPDGQFEKRFVPQLQPPYYNQRGDKVRVHVSDYDKMVIVTFRFKTEDNSAVWKIDHKLLGNRLSQSSRYEEANRILTTVMSEFPTYQIVLNGFCLGGALALHFSKLYNLPAYAFNPAPLVDIYYRVTAAAGFSIFPLGVVNLVSLTGIGYSINRWAGGQAGMYWKIMMPQASGYSLERQMDMFELYAATHRAVPGVAGLAQIHAVAGDRKPAPYFLLNREGKDVEGYTLHLYPAICRRHYAATHAIAYTGALMPTTAHPIWKKEPRRARYVTFPSAKAYSKKAGSDSTGMTYKFIEAILDIYDKKIVTPMPDLQYMHFPRSDSDLLGESNPLEAAMLQDPRPKRLHEALNKDDWDYQHFSVLPYDERERADSIQGIDMIWLLKQQQRENQQAPQPGSVSSSGSVVSGGSVNGQQARPSSSSVSSSGSSSSGGSTDGEDAFKLLQACFARQQSSSVSSNSSSSSSDGSIDSVHAFNMLTACLPRQPTSSSVSSSGSSVAEINGLDAFNMLTGGFNGGSINGLEAFIKITRSSSGSAGINGADVFNNMVAFLANRPRLSLGGAPVAFDEEDLDKNSQVSHDEMEQYENQKEEDPAAWLMALRALMDEDELATSAQLAK